MVTAAPGAEVTHCAYERSLGSSASTTSENTLRNANGLFIETIEECQDIPTFVKAFFLTVPKLITLYAKREIKLVIFFVMLRNNGGLAENRTFGSITAQLRFSCDEEELAVQELCKRLPSGVRKRIPSCVYSICFDICNAFRSREKFPGR